MTTLLAAAGTGKTMWYLTRGSGAVTLALLTAGMVLGIAGPSGWRSARFPRFGIAALHRNLTLLAVVFLGIHVVTTVADRYTPIGWRDAVIPFLSPYRPLWLGLGALAADVLLALVLTSLLRVRLGLRSWRFTHWFAYACWPLALFHSLGTGSDPRAGWLQVLAGLSLGAVLTAVLVRFRRSDGDFGRRVALGGAAVAIAATAGLWYRGGPGAAGWAKKAGTPANLLKSGSGSIVHTISVKLLPNSFAGRIAGTISQQSTANGLVDVHLDGNVTGGVRGKLRVVLEGVPLDDGGVSMTASGVSFAARGTSVYQGRIVGLQGREVAARLSDGSGHTVDLALVLNVSETSNVLTGTVDGRTA
jgi:hypothetical protein